MIPQSAVERRMAGVPRGRTCGVDGAESLETVRIIANTETVVGGVNPAICFLSPSDTR